MLKPTRKHALIIARLQRQLNYQEIALNIHREEAVERRRIIFERDIEIVQLKSKLASLEAQPRGQNDATTE